LQNKSQTNAKEEEEEEEEIQTKPPKTIQFFYTKEYFFPNSLSNLRALLL
jgi:hypothetical protein